jgi:predicted Zn-dependent protease with MMP-like domain
MNYNNNNSNDDFDDLEQYILSLGGKLITDIGELNRWDDFDIEYYVKEIGQAANLIGYYHGKTIKERFDAINGLVATILKIVERKKGRYETS